MKHKAYYELNKPGDAIDSSNTYYGKMIADVVDNFKVVKKNYNTTSWVLRIMSTELSKRWIREV